MELSKLMGCVKRPFIPSELFRGGLIDGAWFDPSDLSTLYQDAAGTTPVTAVEQPIGKMLDKSGNNWHATQSITASRPTLSARYNLLTKTEDFSDAAWTKVGITLSQALGPNGVTGAYKITEDLTTGVHRLSQAVSSSASSYIVYIKNDGANYCAVSWRGNSDIRYDVVRYNLLTKSKIFVQDASGLYVSDSIVDIGDGWLKVTVTLKSAAQFHVACANQTKDPSYLVTYTGDGVSGLIVYHPQVSPSVTTPYQRVNTATDYDTDELYFPKYLRFDGVDDYFNLPLMNLAGSNLGTTTIVAMASRSASAGVSYVLSEKTTYQPVTVYGPVCLVNGLSHRVFMMKDDLQLLNTGYDVQSGRANVFSVTDDLVNITQRKNGVITNQVAFTHPAMTTNNTLIGASNHGGVLGNYLAGNLYSMIITKSALTDAQRIACERHLSRKAGVQL